MCKCPVKRGQLRGNGGRRVRWFRRREGGMPDGGFAGRGEQRAANGVTGPLEVSRGRSISGWKRRHQADVGVRAVSGGPGFGRTSGEQVGAKVRLGPGARAQWKARGWTDATRQGVAMSTARPGLAGVGLSAPRRVVSMGSLLRERNGTQAAYGGAVSPTHRLSGCQASAMPFRKAQ